TRRVATFDQLWRKVVRGSDQLSVFGQPRRVRGARETEIGERHGSVRVEQEVRRFDVAMENPLVVERVEPLAELRCEIDRLVQAQAPGVAQALCQRAAGIEGQDQ